MKAQRKAPLRVNPVRASSAVLLAVSPFLTWITVVSVVLYNNVPIFGAAAQSDLLMVSSNQLGTNISDVALASSFISVFLLLAAGVTMLKSPKLGVPIAIAAVAAYVITMMPSFGSSSAGLEETFISPGIGLFVAVTGIVLGSISPLFDSSSLPSLAHGLKSSQGLSKIGASLAVVGLSLDVSNHAVLGQLPDFIGLTPTEQILHLGLVAGVASMTASVLLRNRLGGKHLLFIAAATLALLGADALYSSYTGNLHDFLGHNLTETALHLSVYYGVALATIAGLVRRRGN